MSESELDRTRVEQLTTAILLSIKANYLAGPISRERALEALNALAAATAVVIHGSDGPGGEAHLFFADAFGRHLHSEEFRQELGKGTIS